MSNQKLQVMDTFQNGMNLAGVARDQTAAVEVFQLEVFAAGKD